MSVRKPERNGTMNRYLNLSLKSRGFSGTVRFFGLSVFLVLFWSLELAAQPLKFDLVLPESTGSFQIRGDGLLLTSDFGFPETHPGPSPKEQWKHLTRSEKEKVLAGTAGKVIQDHFSSPGFDLIREVWISDAKDAVALRQIFWNRSSRTVHLKSLIPLLFNGSDSFILSNEKEFSKWDVLIQERHKNGLPRTIQPSGKENLEVDPFCVFHVRDKEGPALLLGYLSQTGHLARIMVQSEKQKSRVGLRHMYTECEFDSVVVPQGGKRTSQWVFVRAGRDPDELIEDYTERVAQYHGIKEPPKTAPSVFCTWYFHSRYYNETYFTEDLDALRERHMPFDVFLIDECWSMNTWGDWMGNEAWPGGMKKAADRIRELGYTPGIWTCPYLVDSASSLAKNHPEWLLKNTKGENVIFFMNQTDHWVLDPTYPGACEYLEDLYRRLRYDWGYTYFKFDFMRAVFVAEGQRFYDPLKTRLEAYTMGLEAIRRGAGPDAYISVCGGHYGGSLGLANSQRSGSDVVSIWRPKEIPKFRQNILRTWMSRLWHVDPDAMMVRKRTEMMHDSEITLGLLTDDEALTVALNQYIGGGLVCFTEYMKELSEDRYSLYRHVIPSVNSASIPLDLFDPFCPGLCLTEIEPKCSDLKPWVTVSVVNWSDSEKNAALLLSEKVLETLEGERFLVSEFFSQKVLGLFKSGETVDTGFLAPHTSRLLRIVPWDGKNPVLAGTDLHFSGGGVEISEWKHVDGSVQGELNTEWNYPVHITAAFPAQNRDGYISRTVIAGKGQKRFWIDPDTAEPLK